MSPPIAPADLRLLPLESLELAEQNVRTTPAGASADAELRASIAAHGILENLVVRPIEDGRFAVVAGGRRLGAARALAEDGVLEADHPVPCRVLSDDTDAQELSLAENTARAAMHPADQVSAFRTLADAGTSPGAIAARFGVSEHLVAQRLRLGNVAPELLDAYRNDQMSLAALRAFALDTDPVRQRAVWEELRAQEHPPTPWQIKRRLAEGRVPANCALGRFVGVQAYEAAGGRVIRDLFAEDHENGVWLEDPGLVHELAGARLRSAAEALRPEWAWVEVQPTVEWNTAAQYRRVRAQPQSPSEAERTEIEQLEKELEALEAHEDRDDAIEARFDAGRERLRTIARTVEDRARFRPEDRAIAGCIVTIDPDGTLEVLKGLVRPEDLPDATGNGTARTHGHAHETLAPRTGAARRKATGIGVALGDDLRAIRTTLIKSALACDFEAAFDLLLFQLAHKIFGDREPRPFGDDGHDAALQISARRTPDQPPGRANNPDFTQANVGKKFLEADRATHCLDWLEQPPAEGFAQLCAMDPDRKRQLFSSCVARTLQGQLAYEEGARPEVEATFARLDLDLGASIRSNPTPVWSTALLWSRLPKAKLVEIARTTLGEAWASSHAKDKKTVIAEAMAVAFDSRAEVPADVTPEGRAAALAWLPPGFAAFDDAKPQCETGET